MSDNYRLNYRGLQTYDRLLKQYIEDKLPDVFQGATRTHDGTEGLVPAPIIGDQIKYLKGDGTWSNIPSFITLYDTNEEQITFQQTETEISIIEAILTKKVDLEGHFAMSLFSSKDCYLYLRIYDNNIPEIFCPKTYILHAGYNTITLPHAYIGVNADTHYYTVTAQCSDGQITIPTRSLLFTIFGSIDDSYDVPGIDIIDIAVRQTSGNTPSEIWSIGYDEGELILRKNGYNNPNQNPWIDIYNFGSAITGAIEFYGTWIKNDNNREILQTESTPYIFVVDANNNLQVHSGNFETPILLSEDVVKVSACIGYKSNIDNNLDQGMVVAFLKQDGNVYYRQLKRQNNNDSWFPMEIVYSGEDAIDVEVHRLPDYRIGILVKTESLTKWYITDRTFVGTTFKEEYISDTINGYTVIDMVPAERISESLGVATINTFEQAYYYNGFIMTFEGDLNFVGGKTISDLKASMTVSRAGTSIPIESVTIDGNKLIVYTTNDVQCGSTCTISWSLTHLITTNVNNSRMLITQRSYTWDLPANVEYQSCEDEVSAKINGSINILVQPIERPRKSLTDSMDSTINGTPSIIVGVINRPATTVPDNLISSTVSGSLNTVVSLVGDTPI